MTEVTPSLSERSMSPRIIVTNQRKAAFREKQDSKKHKILSINFNIGYGKKPESMVNSYSESLFQVAVLS